MKRRGTLCGQPRIRMAESELDEQIFASLDSLRVESDEFREEFREGLRSLTNEELRLAKLQDDEIHLAYTRIAEQQSQLLDLRLDEEIDRETYAAKATELRDKQRAWHFTWRRRAVEGTRSSTSQSKRLNFHKSYAANGLRLITPPNVESSKSSV